MAASRHDPMLEPGDEAPDFELQDAEGRTWSMRELVANGPAVIAFFKTTCPVCQLTLPFLERLYSQGVQIFGISQDDPESTREFNEEFGIKLLPILFDTAESGYPVSNAYQISHVPSAFRLEIDSRISWTMEGFDKKALESLGEKSRVPRVFMAEDRVPAFKPG